MGCVWEVLWSGFIAWGENLEMKCEETEWKGTVKQVMRMKPVTTILVVCLLCSVVLC